MMPAIARKSTAEVLPVLLDRFGLRDARKVGGFESDVYGTAERILKLTHTLRRPPGLIEAELHFTAHLARGGANVARPLTSRAGRHVEMHPDPEGGAWIAYAFARVPGVPVTADLAPREVARAWGHLTGGLHALARTYVPDPALPARDHWFEEPLLDLTRWTADLGPERMAGEGVIARIRAWPHTPDTYGLIHTDLHEDNVHWDGARLWAFDFDDCEHHHFLNDLAVTVHSLPSWLPDAEMAAPDFLRAYLPAYAAHLPLPDGWWTRMDDLLRLRDVLLLGLYHEAWELGTARAGVPQARAVGWARLRARVVTGTPVLRVNWADLAGELRHR